MAVAHENENVRYEPNDDPPSLLAVGAGFQAAMIIVAPVVLTVVIVARIADQPDSYMSWGVFAALIVSGATTILQAVRVGRLGAGHVLIMGTSGAFIRSVRGCPGEGRPGHDGKPHRRIVAVPVRAGGPALTAAADIHPGSFRHRDNADSCNGHADRVRLADGRAGRRFPSCGPAAALATLATVAALVLRPPSAWRLWSPVIGIAVGCAVSAPFGLFDVQPVLDAPWVGAPLSSWPGFDVSPGVEFWALLPAFVVVTLVGAIETIGDGVAIL